MLFGVGEKVRHRCVVKGGYTREIFGGSGSLVILFDLMHSTDDGLHGCRMKLARLWDGIHIESLQEGLNGFQGRNKDGGHR